MNRRGSPALHSQGTRPGVGLPELVQVVGGRSATFTLLVPRSRLGLCALERGTQIVRLAGHLQVGGVGRLDTGTPPGRA